MQEIGEVLRGDVELPGLVLVDLKRTERSAGSSQSNCTLVVSGSARMTRRNLIGQMPRPWRFRAAARETARGIQPAARFQGA